MNFEDMTRSVENLTHSYPDNLEKLNFDGECQHLSAHLISLKIEKISAKELNSMIIEKEMLRLYPNINIALIIYLCLMVTNCSSERLFSVLKRILNYLRSTQTQNRLNSLAILCIERELTQITMGLDCEDIINKGSSRVR